MPVHVYGRPADIGGLQNIADSYGLRIIYDAAHCFGAKYQGRSLADYGDLSVLSFHATKVFNTFEGGAIISRDAQTKKRIDYLKNFGFAGETTVVASGINGKMNEFQSALGLLQLRYVDNCIRRRGEIARRYDVAFESIAGIDVLGGLDNHVPNFSYYPIFVGREFPVDRDALYAALRASGIYGRRYFYPLISDFPMYRGRPSASRESLPVASQIADSVICLPIYPELSEADQQRVIDCVRRTSA
jgi:dTDP-4-amino-4,6-dideoxygalactose transaminase